MTNICRNGALGSSIKEITSKDSVVIKTFNEIQQEKQIMI